LRPTRSDIGAADGFTLIEGLVTLALVAAAVGAIAGVSDQSHRASLAVAHRMALTATTRMIEASLPGRAESPDGERSGVLDNHQWRLKTSMLPPTGEPESATPWRPHKLSLQVRGPNGETLWIETIRLQRQVGP